MRKKEKREERHTTEREKEGERRRLERGKRCNLLSFKTQSKY